MKNQTIIRVVVCAICFLFYRCNNSAGDTPIPEDSAASNTNMYGGYTSQVEWGNHIATIMGCGDCHTPKKMTDRGPVDDSSLYYQAIPGKYLRLFLRLTNFQKAWRLHLITRDGLVHGVILILQILLPIQPE
jgi:predicted CxxxxCH...CXXCH cytochrome family protein